MSTTAAMGRAEQALMQMTDAETGEFIFYNKDKLVEAIVIEVLVAFFADPGVAQLLILEGRK